MKLLPRLLSILAFVLLGFIVLLVVMHVTQFGGEMQSVQSLKYYQILQSILLFALPAWFCALRWSNGDAISFLSIKRPWSYSSFCWVVLLLIGCYPIINVLVYWNEMLILPSWLSSVEDWMKALEMSNRDLLERFLNVSNVRGLAFNLLVMAITPAICEELLFRGLLQRVLMEKIGIHGAIWVSAIVFSTIHFQFYGFVPRLLLGVIFGYLLFYSGSLLVPMFAHFLYNGSVVVFYYVGQQDTLSQLGVTSHRWLSIVGLVFLLISFYGLSRIGTRHQYQQKSRSKPL